MIVSSEDLGVGHIILCYGTSCHQSLEIEFMPALDIICCASSIDLHMTARGGHERIITLPTTMDILFEAGKPKIYP